jgi:hypothetical protein
LLDQHAPPHSFEHGAVDSVSMPPIGYYQIRVDARSRHLGLSGRRGHENDLDLVVSFEHASDSGFVEWT